MAGERDDDGTSDTVAFPMSGKGEKRPLVDFYHLAPGTVLAGKYRVDRIVGKGGMGVVCLAQHLQMGAPVAMKVLSPEHVMSKEAVARFVREARAASKLSSEHAVRVLDVGTLDGGEPFLVMEYLDGADLSSYARGKKLEVSEVVELVAQACEAIAEAHEAGIVHRDIKPANLFLSKKPNGAPLVKVLDFGVSHVDDADGVRLTQTSTVLGSACYMSPEAMRSAKRVDKRTDVYALGCCLYELLAGQPPFLADTFEELCRKVYAGNAPSVRTLRPDVPVALSAVVDKALARDPKDRFQSVPELVKALLSFAKGSARASMQALLVERGELAAPRSEPPPKNDDAKARGVPWIAVALLVALGVVPIAYMFRNKIVTTFASPVLYVPPSQRVESPPLVEASGPSAQLPSSLPSTPSDRSQLPSSLPSTPSDRSQLPSSLPSTPSDRSHQAPSVPTAPAPSAPATSKPSSRAIAEHAPKPQPSTTAPPAPATGARVNSDLSQESCFATMPDGTRKQVPCP